MLPQIEAEARNVVAGLLPVQKVFKPDAWIIHMESRWDPISRTVQTVDDDRIEAIEETDPEYLCEQDLLTFLIISPPDLLRPGPQDMFNGEDDSVSTLNTKGSRKGLYKEVLQRSAFGPQSATGADSRGKA